MGSTQTTTITPHVLPEYPKTDSGPYPFTYTNKSGKESVLKGSFSTKVYGIKGYAYPSNTEDNVSYYLERLSPSTLATGVHGGHAMIIIEDLTDQLKTVLVKAPRGGTQEIMLEFPAIMASSDEDEWQHKDSRDTELKALHTRTGLIPTGRDGFGPLRVLHDCGIHATHSGTEDTHKSASIYTVKYNGVLKSDNNAEGPDPTVLGKRFVKGGEAEEDNTRTNNSHQRFIVDVEKLTEFVQGHLAGHSDKSAAGVDAPVSLMAPLLQRLNSHGGLREWLAEAKTLEDSARPTSQNAQSTAVISTSA